MVIADCTTIKVEYTLVKDTAASARTVITDFAASHVQRAAVINRAAINTRTIIGIINNAVHTAGQLCTAFNI